MLEPTDNEREWQSAVVKELRDLSTANSQTAVILERLTNKIEDIDEWRKELRATARDAPTTQAILSGTAAQWLIAIIAVAALFLSSVGHITFR